MSGGARRPRQEGLIDGTPWTLFDAGRTASGLGLGYFVRDDLGAGDRRAALATEVEVGRLDDEAFRRLWEAGRGLTATERRLVDDGGGVWLAQGTGPVWAEGGTAAGAVGIRLRCVSAEHPVVEWNGVALADTPDAALAARVGGSEGVAPSSD
ncbi:hypothetical protein [Candidatus Palauibacter sp.]|uniref:hypothetical protein n=1 Tax=Candidatus Palauibacter sp. TaxID=3101350 RepID=UPI003CC55779